jgi:gluconate 2-dehydrogenase alpha chain
VGGAGFHWNGMMYRNLPEELEMRTHHEQKYGKKFIPEDMTIQDHGVTYKELEPFYDFSEKVMAVPARPAISRARSSRRQPAGRRAQR